MNKKNALKLANVFAALGQERRIVLFSLLLEKPTTGLHFNELASATKIPPSTLSHHLKGLEDGGVIERIAMGRSTLFKPRTEELLVLLQELVARCCQNEENSA